MKLKIPWPRLRKMNNREFNAVPQKIEATRTEVTVIQNKLQQNWTDDILEQERNTLQNLEKWSMVE